MNELEKLIEEEYVPTSTERKRAVMMYFVIWILIWINVKKLSKYELFHLKQAIGFRIIFLIYFIITFFFFVVSMAFIFFMLIPLIFFIFIMIVFYIFLKQALSGFYVINKDRIFLPFFYYLWNWVYELFLENNKE